MVKQLKQGGQKIKTAYWSLVGAASAMIFQVINNVGMCLGVTPVIGLTLPFFSYGGSSIVTTYAMLGLVSGVHARPAPRSHERYIRPPLEICKHPGVSSGVLLS